MLPVFRDLLNASDTSIAVMQPSAETIMSSFPEKSNNKFIQFYYENIALIYTTVC